MVSAKNYDWSTLDRSLIREMITASASNIVSCPLTPHSFTKKIRDTFRYFEVPVKVTMTKNKEVKKDAVWVGGLYDSIKDKKNNKFITVSLNYNPKQKQVKLSNRGFNGLAINVADTLLHEIIHTRQYRRRNFKDIPGYESTAELGKQRRDQVYYGHDDEIDAYAFNIACLLNDRFKGDKKQIVQYLNSDLRDRRLKKNAYRTYLATFDHDHNHRVIKKLKKKVMYYLPYTEIGKPYKTADWLK
jgi:hypothetical protein